jgi:hypothetical protein
VEDPIDTARWNACLAGLDGIPGSAIGVEVGFMCAGMFRKIALVRPLSSNLREILEVQVIATATKGIGEGESAVVWAQGLGRRIGEPCSG